MDVAKAQRKAIALVSSLTAVDRRQLKASTDLFRDLGVDGDDAVEVIDTIAERWDVDFSTMRWNQHFGPEQAWSPLRWFRLEERHWRQLQRVPVTIRDLAEAIASRRWSMNYPPVHYAFNGD
ncbi:MAG: DUF1493 family protein [Planctomycetota bacterium]